MSEKNTETLLLNTISPKLREHSSYEKLRAKLPKGASTLQVVQGGFLHLFLATLYAEADRRVMVVFPNELDAESCAQDLANWDIPSTIFPWWQGYRPLPIADSTFGERSAALHSIASSEKKLILTSLRAFLTAVPPENYIKKQQITIQKGSSIDPIEIAERLTLFGYQRVPKVHLHGEFALRGEVLDVFLTGNDVPTRITLDYSTVAEIRSIDPITQRSEKHYSRVVLYSACEVVWDTPSFEALRKSYSQFKQYATALSYEDIELGKHARGEEFFYPYVFPGSYPADYLHKKKGDLLIYVEYDRLKESEYAFASEYEKTVENLPAYSKTHAVLDDYRDRANLFIHYSALGRENREEAGGLSFNIKENTSFYGNIELFKEEVERSREEERSIIVCAGNELQARRIATVLHDESIIVLPDGISSGFNAPDLNMLVVAERELFGRKQTKSLQTASSESIRSVTELELGDYVVHVMHGIGLFKGITRMKVRENERDYIHLEYAEEEFLYVPIEQTNMVQKYVGYGDGKVKLDTLGTKAWQQRKARVKVQIEELADRLVRLYSHRQIATGFAFAPDSEWQLQFEASFPYTETRDQLKCIADVKADMEAERPMDRLVCGDVGFGKTEIAIRAAFKAVTNGKQVAILAPTTILAEQHYERIVERMERFPVSVGMLSRFVPRDKQREIIIGLREGTVDLVVGTHRLIGADVGFKDLGLIILDEEQRFGVKAKERLKEIKTSVDCITMTATPIPRTLHMSLLKLRSVSFVRTPPLNRKSIHTIVDRFDETLIVSAIKYELQRGGQVYYMHNRVEDIESVHSYIETIVPEAIVEVVHGQMRPNILEERIHRFMHKGSNVLVTTSIIENGIDIPNVNTIIIDRADLYGVAQLYQLRGRVGRSERQSYAYLLYPDEGALTDTARKRLEIIADNTELGAGFQVALKDMEVRGTGNLLGRQQSGNIIAVGFDLYVQLLQDAINNIHSDGGGGSLDVQLELEYSGFIPDSYIPDPAQKIDMYRNIASVNKPDELLRLREEMEDRFGQIPSEVHSLLALSDIRILCKSLSILSIRERKNIARIEFGNLAVISPEKVASIINEMPDKVCLDPNKANVLVVKTKNTELQEKSLYISDILKRIL